MKTIEEITEAIIAESQTRHELQCGGSNWHSLILTAEGEVYWSEEIDQYSCSRAVWEGEDTKLISFQGWTPDAPFAYYDMTEATMGDLVDITRRTEEFPDEEEVTLGELTFYKGEKYYGFDPTKWYREGPLLSFRDANPDVSDEDYMADAVATAESFLATRNGGGLTHPKL